MEDNGVMTVSVIPQYKPLIAEFKDIDKLSSADFEISFAICLSHRDGPMPKLPKQAKNSNTVMVGSIFSPGKGGESLLLR